MPKQKESVLKLGKIFPAALFFCLASGDTSERVHQPGQMAANTFLESYILTILGHDECLKAVNANYQQVM